MNAQIHPFFDDVTGTVSYVVQDTATGSAAIIDPVLGFDAKSGHTNTRHADLMISFVRQRKLTVKWILETHAHADHLSSAQYLKRELGGKTGIGENIRQVQQVFGSLFNVEPQFRRDGSQFDHLFADGEIFKIGTLEVKALLLPGHTPADMAYQLGDTVFVGDTLFMPDVGTARCDFPGGNAHTLYQSIRKLLALPLHTTLLMCHDYPPEGRAAAWQTTVQQQRERNIHVHDGVSEEAFVALRTARDKTLEMPQLIIPSVQVNIRAGAMPPAETNGITYLKIPLNAL